MRSIWLLFELIFSVTVSVSGSEETPHESMFTAVMRFYRIPALRNKTLLSHQEQWRQTVRYFARRNGTSKASRNSRIREGGIDQFAIARRSHRRVLKGDIALPVIVSNRSVVVCLSSKGQRLNWWRCETDGGLFELFDFPESLQGASLTCPQVEHFVLEAVRHRFDVRRLVSGDRTRLADLTVQGPEIEGATTAHHRNDFSLAQGFIAESEACIEGYCTYSRDGDEWRIETLRSFNVKRGVGSALLGRLVLEAWNVRARALRIYIPNDNLGALAFLQKHGFRIVAVHLDTLSTGSNGEPRRGIDGVPVRDEIEMHRFVRAT